MKSAPNLDRADTGNARGAKARSQAKSTVGCGGMIRDQNIKGNPDWFSGITWTLAGWVRALT